MKAMIFAAGLGTRLQPLTDKVPKALVQVNGKTLLEIAIGKLLRAGFNEIVVNVHHFSEQVIQFISDRDLAGAQISISDETKQLLDTGGGLIKASWFFSKEEPFLAYNVDVISDIDLKGMYAFHMAQHHLVTLAVKTRASSRQLLFDERGFLFGRMKEQVEGRIKKKNKTTRAYSFSGIHIISPEIFSLCKKNGGFPIMDLYIELAQAGYRIGAYPHEKDFWIDAGKPDSLKRASEILPYLKNL